MCQYFDSLSILCVALPGIVCRIKLNCNTWIQPPIHITNPAPLLAIDDQEKKNGHPFVDHFIRLPVHLQPRGPGASSAAVRSFFWSTREEFGRWGMHVATTDTNTNLANRDWPVTCLRRDNDSGVIHSIRPKDHQGVRKDWTAAPFIDINHSHSHYKSLLLLLGWLWSPSRYQSTRVEKVLLSIGRGRGRLN